MTTHSDLIQDFSLRFQICFFPVIGKKRTVKIFLALCFFPTKQLKHMRSRHMAPFLPGSGCINLYGFHDLMVILKSHVDS